MQSFYRAKKDYIRRNIANCEVIIPIGGNVADFNGFIELNSTAAYIWDRLAEGTTKNVLINEVCCVFEISKEEAEQDISEYIAVLLEHGMIEEIK